MDEPTRELLWDAAAAAFLILSPLLLVIALRVVHYLGKILNLKDLQLAEWAVRQGILWVEEHARKRVMTSEEKRAMARSKARSLAPAPLKRTSDAELDEFTEAQLTLLKPSIRPQAFLASLAPPALSLRPPEVVIPPGASLPDLHAEVRRSLSEPQP